MYIINLNREVNNPSLLGGVFFRLVQTQATETSLDSLPLDIHRMILSHLPFIDQLQLSCTNHALRNLVIEERFSIEQTQLQTLHTLLKKYVIQPSYQTILNDCIAIINTYEQAGRARINRPLGLAHDLFYTNVTEKLINLLKEMEAPDLRALQVQFNQSKRLSKNPLSPQLTSMPMASLIYKKIENSPPADTFLTERYVRGLSSHSYPHKALQVLDQFLTRGSNDHTKGLEEIIWSCCLDKEFRFAIQIVHLMPSNLKPKGFSKIIKQMIQENLLDQAELILNDLPPVVLSESFIFPLTLAFLKKNQPQKALLLFNQPDLSPNYQNELLVELATFTLKNNGSAEALLFIENNIHKISNRNLIYKNLLKTSSNMHNFNSEFFTEIINKFLQENPTASNTVIENLILDSLLFTEHFKEVLLLLLARLNLESAEWLSGLSITYSERWMQGYYGGAPFIISVDLIHLIHDVSKEQPAIFNLMTTLLVDKRGSSRDRNQFFYLAKELAENDLIDTTDKAYQSEAHFIIFRRLCKEGKTLEALDYAEKIQDKQTQKKTIQMIRSQIPPTSKPLVEDALNKLPHSATFLDQLREISFCF